MIDTEAAQAENQVIRNAEAELAAPRPAAQAWPAAIAAPDS